MVVPFLCVTTGELGITGVCEKAPPVEEGYKNCVGSSAITDASINRESLLLFSQKRLVFLIRKGISGFDSIWDEFIRPHDGIIDLPDIFVKDGGIDKFGGFGGSSGSAADEKSIMSAGLTPKFLIAILK